MLKKLLVLLSLSAGSLLEAMHVSQPLQENVRGTGYVVQRPLYKNDLAEEEFTQSSETPLEQASKEKQLENMSKEYRKRLLKMPTSWPADEQHREAIRQTIGKEFADRYLKLSKVERSHLVMDMFSYITQGKADEELPGPDWMSDLANKKEVLEIGINSVLHKELHKARL